MYTYNLQLENTVVKHTHINEQEHSEDDAPKMKRINQNIECSKTIDIFGELKVMVMN